MKRAPSSAFLLCLASLLACSQPKATTPPASVPEPAPAKPEAPALPEASTVLAHAVEAAGGAAAHEALASYYSEWRMEIAAQGLTADSRLWWKKGKFYMEVDMPGVGRSKVWCDGTTVTSEDRFNGRRVLEGKEATQARWAASVSLAHDWQQYFASAKTTGRRELDGQNVVDVVLSGADGLELTLSFDEKAGLLRAQSFTQQSPMGAMPIEIAMVEYKPIAGIQQAVRTETRMPLFTAVTTIGKFEANVDIDDAKFVPTTEAPPAAPPTPPPAEAKPTPKVKAKSKASPKSEAPG